jgi:hypothetical protein
LRLVQVSRHIPDSIHHFLWQKWLPEAKRLFPAAANVSHKVRQCETQPITFQIQRHKIARFRVQREDFAPAAGVAIAIACFVKNASRQEVAKRVTDARRVQAGDFDYLDATEIPAPVEQTQDLAEPLIRNLDSGLSPKRCPIRGCHLHNIIACTGNGVNIYFTKYRPTTCRIFE